MMVQIDHGTLLVVVAVLVVAGFIVGLLMGIDVRRNK